MRSFGFDYFVGRAEVLTEMANVARIFNHISPSFNEVYKQLLPLFFSVGKLPKNNCKDKTLKYLIYFLGKLNENVGSDVPDLGSDEDLALDPKAYIKRGKYKDEFDGGATLDVEYSGKSDPITNLIERMSGKGRNFGNAQLQKIDTVEKLYAKDPEYAESEEFKNLVFDHDNIRQFADAERVSPISNFSFGTARTKEKLHGKDIEDIHNIQTSIPDLLRQINKLNVKKIRSLTKNLGNYNTPEQSEPVQAEESGDVQNIQTDNISIITSAIEYLKDYSNELQNEFLKARQKNPKMSPDGYFQKDSDLQLFNSDKGDKYWDYLINAYKAVTKGIDIEKFNKQMDNMSSKNPQDSHIFKMLKQIVAREVKNARQSDSFDAEILANRTSAVPNTEYVGYFPDVLDEVLKTPEDKKAFDEFYKAQQITIGQQMERLQKKLDILTAGDPDEFKKGTERFWKIRKKDPMANVEFTPAGQEEEDEEYDIMDTFVESLQSTYYKPKGQFVDRGFKKYSNYAQWLMNND